ncbi:MAG: monovalent cation:proton antiporter-2 (CPA2) family protein [Pseudomonadota bacterium]
MATGEEHGFLIAAGVFLGAAVLAVPLAKRLGLGSILGYLAAGALIGPAALGLIAHPKSILSVSEFGVVLLLFVIGLELEPRRLWAMKRDIFGLGLAQVIISGAVLTGLAVLMGLAWPAAITAGFALALSSTAFALQIMEENGSLNTRAGSRAFSILLFQDLAIVPLLALVAALSPQAPGLGGWQAVGVTLAVVLGFVLLGGRLLRPLLRAIARTDNREIFAATALLLVVASALLMAAVGLSMAMGAFLAGVLLAESEYRHQLEADIEPFRGLFLGLFFMSVGMSVDWALVAREWALLLALIAGLMLIKGGLIYGLTRLFGARADEALHNAVTLPQGGEFAFVLFTAAAAQAVMDGAMATLLIAAVTGSMAATPLVGFAGQRLKKALGAKAPAATDLDRPEGKTQARAIVAGFGRMGQIVAQILMARGISVTAIDSDPERIRAAAEFGNKVYFGDAQRLDVLRAAGVGEADMLFITVGARRACVKTLQAIRQAFPKLKVATRAFDRFHALDLMRGEADVVVRETFESAVAMGREGLRQLGVEEHVVTSIEEEFRRRDHERLLAQMGGDAKAKMETVFTRFDAVAEPQDGQPKPGP